MTKTIHFPSAIHYSIKSIAALAAIYAFIVAGPAASFSYHQNKFVGI
jgi:hypothetical protein